MSFVLVNFFFLLLPLSTICGFSSFPEKDLTPLAITVYRNPKFTHSDKPIHSSTSDYPYGDFDSTFHGYGDDAPVEKKSYGVTVKQPKPKYKSYSTSYSKRDPTKGYSYHYDSRHKPSNKGYKNYEQDEVPSSGQYNEEYAPYDDNQHQDKFNYNGGRQEGDGRYEEWNSDESKDEEVRKSKPKKRRVAGTLVFHYGKPPKYLNSHRFYAKPAKFRVKVKARRPIRMAKAERQIVDDGRFVLTNDKDLEYENL